MTDSSPRPMGGYDRQRGDRLAAQAARLVATLAADDYGAASIVLDETGDHPAQLRGLCVALAGWVGGFVGAEEAAALALARVDRLHGNPWPGDLDGGPAGEPENQPPPPETNPPVI